MALPPSLTAVIHTLPSSPSSDHHPVSPDSNAAAGKGQGVSQIHSSQVPPLNRLPRPTSRCSLPRTPVSAAPGVAWVDNQTALALSGWEARLPGSSHSQPPPSTRGTDAAGAGASLSAGNSQGGMHGGGGSHGSLHGEGSRQGRALTGYDQGIGHRDEPLLGSSLIRPSLPVAGPLVGMAYSGADSQAEVRRRSFSFSGGLGPAPSAPAPKLLGNAAPQQLQQPAHPHHPTPPLSDRNLPQPGGRPIGGGSSSSSCPGAMDVVQQVEQELQLVRQLLGNASGEGKGGPRASDTLGLEGYQWGGETSGEGIDTADPEQPHSLRGHADRQQQQQQQRVGAGGTGSAAAGWVELGLGSASPVEAGSMLSQLQALLAADE
ncbi:hypothetical protein V8C86DRAFT_1124145 [Haematococcus lacustris]